MRINQLKKQHPVTSHWSSMDCCNNLTFRSGPNSLAKSSSNTRTAITQSKRFTLSDSPTSCRSASDTVRGPASGFSSPDAVVEQRHI